MNELPDDCLRVIRSFMTRSCIIALNRTAKRFDLIRLSDPGELEHVCEDAIITGSISLLEFLTKLKFNIRTDVVMTYLAAHHGYLNMLKWMMKERFSFANETFCFACGSGNLDMIKWLEETGYILY